MISFFKKKDPEAVDAKLVRRYLRMNRRFNRLYASNSFEGFRRSRDLFYQMTAMRACANRATIGAINQAFGLSVDHCNPR